MLRLRLVATFGIEALDGFSARFSVADHAGKIAVEVCFHVGQQNTILRTFWASQRRQNFAHVQMQGRAVFGYCIGTPQALCLGIGFDQGNQAFFAARQTQIIQCFFINRKNAASRAVFRRHIGNSGTVSQRQMI